MMFPPPTPKVDDGYSTNMATHRVDNSEHSSFLCFSSHNQVSTSHVSFILELIEPDTAFNNKQNKIADRIKFCLVRNVCIEPTGEIVLFHNENQIEETIQQDEFI